MRDENPGGRPRKYASDAERQAAFRQRWAMINVRAEARTKETLKTIAEACNATEADIVNAAVKFYALNFDGWRNALIFGGRLPTVQDPKYREKRERKDANKQFLESED